MIHGRRDSDLSHHSTMPEVHVSTALSPLPPVANPVLLTPTETFPGSNLLQLPGSHDRLDTCPFKADFESYVLCI